MSNLLLFPDAESIPEPRRRLALAEKTVPDADARARALDISCSAIVEAPAGSGKTGLLIQRFLKLLGSEGVNDPAEVLAITFTRKATAEMLDRVMEHLRAADHAPAGDLDDFGRATRALAEDVLARDRQHGWDLLRNPQRFNIRTIDSLAGQIASALPVLSGSGGGQAPTEDPGPLYAEAARRTLMELGGPDAALSEALTLLLLHRDGDLGNCEALIGTMLKTRDQWGELLPLALAELDDRYLDERVLPALDRALDLAVCRSLTELTHLLPAAVLTRLTELADEMSSLDGYKGSPSPVAICAGLRVAPGAKASHLDHWRALLRLLVKPSKPRGWRKGYNVNHIGFAILKQHREELREMTDDLDAVPGLLDSIYSIEALPPPEYPREQWPVSKALFRVLARALAELKVIFAERGVSDFAEVALQARDALRSAAALDDLEAGAGLRLRHLLVDEMQDTSTSQYELLQLLTAGWHAPGQTVFLVGDPKQSIYMFRQARVERFVHMLGNARFADLPLSVLRLTANFRSTPRLVDAFNEDFLQIFSSGAPGSDPDAIPYTVAAAVRSGSGGARRIWHADAIAAGSEPDAARRMATLHGEQMREIILAWRSKRLPHGRVLPWRIAVLVRNRVHLAEVVAALRRPEPIPFRAVDIDPLGERTEILDLLALTRALLHPADRTAWLALLRSPACGLSLADLHRLTGLDDPELAHRTVPALLARQLSTDPSLGTEVSARDRLSPDGLHRLNDLAELLRPALEHRSRAPLAQTVQRTWRALGFPSVLAPEALVNAERFFQLLDSLSAELEPGSTLSVRRLEAKIAVLYASASTASDAVDLMTLHKSKGLEWDVVLVPELHRVGASNRGELLQWMETEPDTSAGAPPEAAAGILAPIASKGRTTHQLNRWMRSLEAAREAAERKRLFYVACTRAREELHLFAAPRRKREGGLSVPAGSLLEAAWPAAEFHFTQLQMPAIAEIAEPADHAALSLAASAPPRSIGRIPRNGVPAPRPMDEDRAFLDRSPTDRPLSNRPLSNRPPRDRPDRAEGGFAVRVFGNTMHTFLERLASALAQGRTAVALAREVASWAPRVTAVLRSNGLDALTTDRLSNEVLRGLRQTLNDPEGRWILLPHPGAASELSVGSEDGAVRLDRTFRAGATPGAEGDDHLWVVDYKTASHGRGEVEGFLAQERAQYAPVLEAYAAHVAAGKRGPVRLALYYPMIPRLVWWTLES